MYRTTFGGSRWGSMQDEATTVVAVKYSRMVASERFDLTDLWRSRFPFEIVSWIGQWCVLLAFVVVRNNVIHPLDML